MLFWCQLPATAWFPCRLSGCGSVQNGWVSFCLGGGIENPGIFQGSFVATGSLPACSPTANAFGTLASSTQIGGS